MSQRRNPLGQTKNISKTKLKKFLMSSVWFGVVSVTHMHIRILIGIGRESCMFQLIRSSRNVAAVWAHKVGEEHVCGRMWDVPAALSVLQQVQLVVLGLQFGNTCYGCWELLSLKAERPLTSSNKWKVLCHHRFSVSEATKGLKGLDPKISAGHDDLPPYFLHLAAQMIAELVSYIFNLSIQIILFSLFEK